MSSSFLKTFSSEWVESVGQLVRAASTKILSVRSSGLWKEVAKSDFSPVTEADLASNTILTNGLRRISPFPIVSEEMAPDLISQDEFFWLVDPLDGTKEFVRGTDSFVVNVALIQNEYPVFGMIGVPVSQKIYWGIAGQGAFCGKQKIQNESTRTDLIALASGSQTTPRFQTFMDKNSIVQVRRYGSALKFCHLAEGVGDLYPRFGDTHEWDTAAGQAIVEEAGCSVLDFQTGARLRYRKVDFLNQGFLAHRKGLKVLF